MARPLRVQFAGGTYHVIARGNAKQPVFLDDEDCSRFIEELLDVAARLDWTVWAYCLMRNHYHLLLQTASPNLARGMRDLNGAYSLGFNRRHDRVGHLFQGRYMSRVVDTTSYLLSLLRYILANPVEAGLCADPGDYRWSSYRATIGLASAPPFLVVDKVLAQFGAHPADCRRRFSSFVRGGVGLGDPARTQRVPGVLGPQSFVEKIGRLAGAPSPEVPRVQRAWPSLPMGPVDRATRDEAIRTAYASGGYTLTAIARHFGLHYTTVSRIARNPSFQVRQYKT